MGRVNTLPHKVISERPGDGSIRLRSAHAMREAVPQSGVWLRHWAKAAPDRIFLGERSGEGWREVRFGETLEMVRSIAGWLVEHGHTQGAGERRPILILSGNGIDHALLTLAAHYVGIPTVPVAEQYSLIPGAHDRLRYIAGKVRPGLVFADDAARYGDALAMDIFTDVPKIASSTDGAQVSVIAFDDLLKGSAGEEVDRLHAAVGPDTLAKILFTSGSTSQPKGVITTQRMMCVNQAQIHTVLEFLRERPPKILDWLPWNHVFGSNHNFNMMLANGGSLYVDDGKPTDQLFPRTLENMKMQSGTICFNVPVGFARQLAALRADDELRKRFFADLDMLFYAGAALPREIWDGLEELAVAETGEKPFMISSWGMTETAPGALIIHEQSAHAGIIGVPLPEVEVKLIPDEDKRCELRVRGPSITPGYYEDEKRTRESFDADGFFMTGDAVHFLDPDDETSSLVFDGRISEDFKLMSGTWVRAQRIRAQALTALNGLAADVVIAGQGHDEIGILVFPIPSRLEEAAEGHDGGAATAPAMVDQARAALAELAESATGSSTKIARAMIMAEPASLPDQEITAKGNLNTAKVLARRAALVERMYGGGDDPAVIRV